MLKAPRLGRTNARIQSAGQRFDLTEEDVRRAATLALRRTLHQRGLLGRERSLRLFGALDTAATLKCEATVLHAVLAGLQDALTTVIHNHIPEILEQVALVGVPIAAGAIARSWIDEEYTRDAGEPSTPVDDRSLSLRIDDEALLRVLQRSAGDTRGAGFFGQAGLDALSSGQFLKGGSPSAVLSDLQSWADACISSFGRAHFKHHPNRLDFRSTYLRVIELLERVHDLQLEIVDAYRSQQGVEVSRPRSRPPFQLAPEQLIVLRALTAGATERMVRTKVLQPPLARDEFLNLTGSILEATGSRSMRAAIREALLHRNIVVEDLPEPLRDLCRRSILQFYPPAFTIAEQQTLLGRIRKRSGVQWTPREEALRQKLGARGDTSAALRGLVFGLAGAKQLSRALSEARPPGPPPDLRGERRERDRTALRAVIRLSAGESPVQVIQREGYLSGDSMRSDLMDVLQHYGAGNPVAAVLRGLEGQLVTVPEIAELLEGDGPPLNEQFVVPEEIEILIRHAWDDPVEQEIMHSPLLRTILQRFHVSNLQQAFVVAYMVLLKPEQLMATPRW